MTESSNEGRSANLLGAFVLAAGDRLTGATGRATGRVPSDTAALVVLTTTLDGTSQDTLGRVLGLTQPGAARLVIRLVDAGLADRRAGQDGRTHAIRVTATGRAAAGQALSARQATAEALLDPLDAGERAQLTGLLEKLLGGATSSRADTLRICRLCDPGACGHYEGRCPVTLAAQER